MNLFAHGGVFLHFLTILSDCSCSSGGQLAGLISLLREGPTSGCDVNSWLLFDVAREQRTEPSGYRNLYDTLLS